MSDADPIGADRAWTVAPPQSPNCLWFRVDEFKIAGTACRAGWVQGGDTVYCILYIVMLYCTLYTVQRGTTVITSKCTSIQARTVRTDSSTIGLTGTTGAPETTKTTETIVLNHHSGRGAELVPCVPCVASGGRGFY